LLESAEPFGFNGNFFILIAPSEMKCGYNMKAYGIGLVILLIAFVVSTYTVYVSYKWISNPPKNTQEVKAMTDELTSTTLMALVTNIVAIVGILVFLVEFRTHEHEVTPTKAPPPP
jgi:uncharacterized membrane-anchored protein